MWVPRCPFSLTNFGPFGGLYASPMIYPPQVAIIGAGRLHQAPTAQNGAIAPAWVLPQRAKQPVALRCLRTLSCQRAR